MRALQQRVAGQLVGQDNKVGLILRELKPSEGAEDLLYLRYALVTIGPGDHIFPAFLLDDWGREVRTLKLYRWVRENGQRFPRAEIFGYEQDGRDTQCFLRELELYARLPTYIYPSADMSVEEGLPLTAIFIIEDGLDKPEKVKRPSDIKGPLRAAYLSWWKVPADFNNYEVLLISDQPTQSY